MTELPLNSALLLEKPVFLKTVFWFHVVWNTAKASDYELFGREVNAKKGPRVITNAKVKILDLYGKLMVSYILTSFLSALSSFIFFTVVTELMMFIT